MGWHLPQAGVITPRESPSPLAAIDFVIPDDEQVRVGHYSTAHVPMTAAEAVVVIMHASDPRGYEVVIVRKIEPDEICRTRKVPQVVGWRYWPDSHGRPPCPCEVCQRGTYKAASLRSFDADAMRRRSWLTTRT